MSYFPYLIGALLLVPAAIQITVMRRSRRMLGAVLPAAPEPLASHLVRHPTSLLYFYSPRCLACNDMVPVVDELATDHPNVIKLNVKDMPEFARAIGLLATPSSVLVRGGRVVQILVGFNSRKKMEKLLGA